jgi:hypothetical protein
MVTSELLTTILSIMESKMDAYEEKPKVKKKVFNVLVECLQNLYHHIDKDNISEEILSFDNSALLMIAKNTDNYQVMTGNYMETKYVNDLKAKLDLVNSMDKLELKSYYKEILSNGNRTEKGTAGLGMIDIARKSGQKLDYHFMKFDDKTTFFSLTVKIAE